MRLVVSLIFLILVNGAAYVFSTRPTSAELERLELRQRELDGVLAVEEETAAKWSQLVELVETAQSVLEPLPSAESSAQSGLRRAFLEAEKGLGLRRDTLEFRPEKQAPSGFGGVRIRVIEAGHFAHFADLVTYLNRISHLKVPLALVEMSLVEAARGSAPLLLTVTFSALWPEESDS
jgi:Tfp pilus assembly protein PilO